MASSSEHDDNQEVFEVLNSYTISHTHDFGRNHKADPELRRIFNFAAQDITSIYSMWYGSAVTSTMQVQKFSELDSLDEARIMHSKLRELGGNPPELKDNHKGLGKPRNA